MAHYIHDDNNNRIEGLSKEEIYALLAEAIQTGQLPSVDEDTAFVTMFKSIVDGETYKMAFCTQAQYNQLEAQGLLVANAYYIITDDESYDDIVTFLNNLQAQISNLVESGANLVKMNLSNTEGKRYVLLTGYNQTSGGNATPTYSTVFYLYGDNSGVYLEDDFKANGLYYLDSSTNTYENVQTKLSNLMYLRDLGIDSITDLNGTVLTNGEITKSQLATGIWVNYTNTKLNANLFGISNTPFIIKYRFVSNVTIGSTVYYNTRSVEEKFILYADATPSNTINCITDKSRFGLVKDTIGYIAKRISFVSSDSNIGTSDKLEILGIYELING